MFEKLIKPLRLTTEQLQECEEALQFIFENSQDLNSDIGTKPLTAHNLKDERGRILIKSDFRDLPTTRDSLTKAEIFTPMTNF